MTDSLQSAARTVFGLLLFQGIVAIAFGVFALFAPTLAALTIVVIIGIFLVVDGIVLIVRGALDYRRGASGAWLLIQGALSLVAGIIALVWPNAAGLVGGLFVLWIVAVFQIIAGVTGLFAPAQLGEKRGHLAVAIISLVFGLILAALLLFSPTASVIGLIWIVGIYAILYGALAIVLAFRARRVGHSI